VPTAPRMLHAYAHHGAHSSPQVNATDAEGNRCLFTMRIAPIGANNANQGRPVYLCEDILLPNARREDLIE